MKSLYQTRWDISASRVVVYPHRMSNLLALIVAVLGVALLVLLYIYENVDILSLNPIILVWLLLILLLVFSARSNLTFDNQSGYFYMKWLGWLTIRKMPFHKLHGIQVINQAGFGGYSYRLFKKSARYGRGIAASSGYSKANDANALALVNEVIPQIHAFLDQHDDLAAQPPEEIISFKYFKEDGPYYTTGFGKWSNSIYGIFFLGMACWIALAISDKSMAAILGQIFFLLLAIVFINGAFTRFIYDPEQGTLQKKTWFAFLNREMDFSYFAGVQTIRHTSNGVYTHTSIHLHFYQTAKSTNATELPVASFYRASHVDRFIQEFNQIMRINQHNVSQDNEDSDQAK